MADERERERGPGEPLPTIPEFYAGRSLFITGGTGFMGKVLVQRLLWTCPAIGRLYLLTRSKRGQTPEKRLQNLKQSPVFESLQQQSPEQLEKLRLVSGDTALPQLGISDESMLDLQEVSVVFHIAATVKFDEELKLALQLNTLSVTRLMDICDQLPNVQVLVHVSTAYSNAERSVVEERVYPLPRPLRHIIEEIEALPDLSQEETQQYIHPKPNTYTYTKALAEAAVVESGAHRYPIAIFRPSIVVSSYKDPFPGWIENYNGPSGVVVATARGLLHVNQCEARRRADLVPVDLAIDTLLAVAWETYVDRPRAPRVYHCSSNENPTSWRQLKRVVIATLRRTPVLSMLWYPCLDLIPERTSYSIHRFFKQTIPMHLMEYILRLISPKNKRMDLIKTNQILSNASDTLLFFSLREWMFYTDNVRRLRARLAPSDAALYNLDPHSIDWELEYANFVLGCRRHMLKESDDSIPRARAKYLRLYVLHLLVTVVAPLVLLAAALAPLLLRGH